MRCHRLFEDFFLRRCLPAATLATASAAAMLTVALPAWAQKGAAPPAPPLIRPAAVVPGPAVNVPASPAPRIVFAGNPLPVPSPALLPFRDSDNVLCVAPESLSPLGITFIVDEKMSKVSLVAPEGNATTVPLRRRPLSSDPKSRDAAFVAIAEVIEALGGKCQWDAATSTLFVRAVLMSVEMPEGQQVRIRATFPVVAKVLSLDGRRKIVVDIPGAEVGALPKTLPLSAPNLVQARTGQFQKDVARVVLELREPSNFILADASTATTRIAVSLLTSAHSNVASAGAKTSPAAAAKAGAATPTMISGVSIRRISDDKAQIVVSAGRALQVRNSLLARGQLSLDLLNTTFGAAALTSLAEIQHPLLRAVRVLTPGGSAARMVMDLSRAVTYTIRPGAAGGLIIDLGLPRSAGGKLAGKLVVVDAGHGGSDAGAKGVNGTYEKNVNLAVARRVAESLRDGGANVIMTRDSDVFIAVNDRPRIANRVGADFFLSIHSDSTGGRNRTVNGSTIYYHLNVASCKALAHCIADRMGDLGGIQSKGVRSDGIRFPKSGFGVLRNSQMVSVLVECGYMTNPGDVARLNDPKMQARIGSAITDGLRDYIEGNPYLDTRNINPQSSGGYRPAAPPPLLPGEVAPDGTVVPEPGEEDIKP